MSATANRSPQIIVDDVVRALTTTEGLVGADGEVLREQMERAAEEFDELTAQAFARALLDALCDDPQDVRKLEALMILGLAHPQILDSNRIPLEAEARRLAVLLERGGEAERARGLLELVAARSPRGEELAGELAASERGTSSSAQLVDRWLARSKEAVHAGDVDEAIRSLQQVLVVDPGRRDVARMIRDLRFQDAERRARNKRRLKLLGFVLAISALMAAVLLRELHLEREYQALPLAVEDDLRSVEGRMAQLDELLASNRFWIGGFRVVNERRGLERSAEALRQRDSFEKREIDQRLGARLSSAEDARVLGMEAAHDGRFEDALKQLRTALEVAPQGWEHRERVARDVEAIERWKSEGR